MQVVLEECGHTIIKQCSDKNPNCTIKCSDRLNCGHYCTLNCHKNKNPDQEMMDDVIIEQL